MLKIDISKSDIELLRHARFNHPHPRVMQKMEVVYLKGLELDTDLICTITGFCQNTVRTYLKQYKKEGIDGLKEINFYRPSSILAEYSGTIENYFIENPPSSISEAAAKIEELTGIKRGETQTRKFLKSMKFKYIKACSVPAKALTEEKKTNNVNIWTKI